MRKSLLILVLTATMAVATQTASASPPLCCGTNGSCDDGQKPQCSDPGVCDPGEVCWSEAGMWCTGAVGGCRLRNGDCILADAACVQALRCTPDAACLMPPNPEPENEEVTWCDADDNVVEEEEPPCEE